jgi:hypothetical protein
MFIFLLPINFVPTKAFYPCNVNNPWQICQPAPQTWLGNKAFLPRRIYA